MPSSSTRSDTRALREIEALIRRGKTLRDRADTAVQQSSTEALLRNTNATAEFATPAGVVLLPHQRTGVRWLLAMHALGSGAVLADDMGLGKTVQTLAFIAALAARGSVGSHLILAPLSTLDGWAAEARRWVPWCLVTVYGGPAAHRATLRARLRRRHRAAFARAAELRALWQQHHPPLSHGARRDKGGLAALEAVGAALGGIVLASYEAALADRGALARMLPWDLVVVDEAQRLKKAGGRLLNILQRHPAAGMRLVLTGTPVQNNARELWTLMGFVAPESFGLRSATVPAVIDDWAQTTAAAERRAHSDSGGQGRGKRPRAASMTVEDDEDSAGLSEVTEEDTAAPGTEPDAGTHDGEPCALRVMSTLQAALRPFLLRRTKADVGLALPPKLQVLVPTPLAPMQRRLYHLAETHDACLNHRLLHLRRCCLYGGWLAHLLPGDASACTETVMTWTALSSKLAALRDMLPELHRRGHRVLLFSQFTTALDVVQAYVEEAMPALSIARLDGRTERAERAALTAQFQATPPRPRAGGEQDGGVGRRGLTHNVENGIVADDAVFSTPPPTPRSAGQPPACRPNSPIISTAGTPQRRTGAGAFLCLVSTRAGGAGLNLTGADTVILFDGDFNPHNDRQAIDRCHRIGQRRPVVVYRLVCPGTVETAQLEAASRKLALSAAALGAEAPHRAGEELFVAEVSHSGGQTGVALRPVSDLAHALRSGDVPSQSFQEGVPAVLMDRTWVLKQCLTDPSLGCKGEEKSYAQVCSRESSCHPTWTGSPIRRARH